MTHKNPAIVIHCRGEVKKQSSKNRQSTVWTIFDIIIYIVYLIYLTRPKAVKYFKSGDLSNCSDRERLIWVLYVKR